MTQKMIKIGFSYFPFKDFLLDHQLDLWFPAMQKWNASHVIFTGNFDIAITEDVFRKAQEFGLEPIVHFNAVLPSARKFNDAAFILDLYRKWGVTHVIFGDQPNTKHGWLLPGQQDETLVDKFLDRFIPLANHVLKIGLTPIMAPLMPGGEFWDCAFMELALDGLKQRKMTELLDDLVLSSNGFTFNKPLSWGEGGPERWPGSKPYYTPDGQQNSLGFHNFEWAQAISQRAIGKKLPVIILDAGNPGPDFNFEQGKIFEDTLRKILQACQYVDYPDENRENGLPTLNESVLACNFRLETLKKIFGEPFSIEVLDQIFSQTQSKINQSKTLTGKEKHFDHYLLLPSYASGVSDSVLNKVRPLIKKFKPTVGFSLEEALNAVKVSVFPDSHVFTDEQINRLRNAGCEVEILPQSGIEIATLFHD